MTPGDWSALGWFSVYLAVVVGASEVLHSRGSWSAVTGRRFVHLAVGLAAAAAPWFFDSAIPVLALSAVFAPFNLVAGRRRWLRGMHDVSRRTDGTATFALALLFAGWSAWMVEPDRVPALQAAFVVLALADPVAGWAGARWGAASRFRAGGDEKSLVGSTVFFFVALAGISGTVAGTGYLGTTVGTGTLGTAGPGTLVVLVVAAALWATVAEAMGRSGWDNLWIVVAIVLVLALVPDTPGAIARLLPSTVIAAGLAAVTFRWRLLDLGGSLGAAVLCFTIAVLGGWGMLLPGATFFLLSSLLSRVGRRTKDGLPVQPEKTGARDIVQVAANGGAAWVVLAAGAILQTPVDGWVLAAFCGAFAAAAADTWSTEIGSLLGGTPRMVSTGRKVPAGTSGAVTLAGLMASAGGAASVAGVSWLLGAPFLVVLVAGVAGGLADSLAGALLQGKWEKAGSIVEIRQEGVPPAKGFAWVGNDLVNLICTAVGAILAAALA